MARIKEERPANPATQSSAAVQDGHSGRPRHPKRRTRWLRRALAAQNAGRLEDVFLATVNAQNQLAVFARTGRQVKRELFE